MWKSVKINKQNILYYTDKSVLIKCPNNSKYHDLTFWHPTKLVSEYSNGFVKIIYNEDWVFKLFKEKNFKITKQEEIDGVIMETLFEPIETYLIIKEPSKINKDVKILEELKNEHK